MELMFRHDGEYGLGRIESQELFVVDESYLVVAGPFLLKDLIDLGKLAALLPLSIRKEMSNDSGQLGPFGPG